MSYVQCLRGGGGGTRCPYDGCLVGAAAHAALLARAVKAAPGAAVLQSGPISTCCSGCSRVGPCDEGSCDCWRHGVYGEHDEVETTAAEAVDAVLDAALNAAAAMVALVAVAVALFAPAALAAAAAAATDAPRRWVRHGCCGGHCQCREWSGGLC